LNRLSDLLLDTTPPPPLEYLIGPVEAAEFLHLSIGTILLWAMAQLIPAHQLRYDGRTAWRFRRSELDEWRKQNPDYASPKGPRRVATSKRKPSVIQKKRTASQSNSSHARKIS
jgi:excisionase family DNA binding protein